MKWALLACLTLVLAAPATAATNTDPAFRSGASKRFQRVAEAWVISQSRGTDWELTGHVGGVCLKKPAWRLAHCDGTLVVIPSWSRRYDRDTGALVAWQQCVVGVYGTYSFERNRVTIRGWGKRANPYELNSERCYWTGPGGP